MLPRITSGETSGGAEAEKANAGSIERLLDVLGGDSSGGVRVGAGLGLEAIIAAGAEAAAEEITGRTAGALVGT